MFSKNKPLSVVLAVIASVLLFLSYWMYVDAMSMDIDSDFTSVETSPTYDKIIDVTEATAEETEFIPMEPTTVELIEETAIFPSENEQGFEILESVELTEETTSYIDAELEGTTYIQVIKDDEVVIEETIVGMELDSVEDSEPIGRSRYKELVSIRDRNLLISKILFVSACVLIIFTLVVIRKCGVVAGADFSLFVLLLCSYLARRIYVHTPAGIFFFNIAFFISIFAVHDLLWFISHKFTLDASIAHRFGRMFSRMSNDTSSYLCVSIIWLIICVIIETILVAMTYSNSSIMRWVALVVTSLCLIISAMILIRYIKAVSHLERQIVKLYHGDDPEALKSIYESSENLLVSLKSERDLAVEKAVVSERFKVDLITNVSHDLRTPLTSIIGFGELLEKEKLSIEGANQLKQLNNKAEYMRRLVDELFELTKVSSGVIEPHFENIDLIKLAEQTCGLLEDKIQAKNLVVKRHYSDNSIILNTDGTMLHQVISNLLGNAIKYSPEGSRIHIMINKESGNIFVRMTNISSYEMDFTPEEIVQRFARGDKARSTSGSGLGLAIAQTYTDAIGGDFHIEIDGEQFIAIVKLKEI